MSKFLIYALAVWRVSNILVNEDGPLDLARRLRDFSGIEATASGKVVSFPSWNPLHCVYCTSVWVAVVLCGLPYIHPVFAASALTVLIERGLVPDGDR